MTDYKAKLEWGKYSLNLNDGRYAIGTDFTPPATAVTAYFASGTSANKYGGGSKAGEKAQNIAWQFTVECSGVSEAEVRRAVTDLTNFLTHAGDTTTPLYFAWQGNSNISVEPTWGQEGAGIRFEIVHSDTPAIGQRYGLANTRKVSIPVTFSVTIKPFGFGKRQKLATASGGILEDTIGTTDGRSRGLQVPEATTNKMTNPVFGHGTWNNGWTEGAGATASQNTDKDFVLWGKSSAKVTADGAASRTFVQSINVGNTNTHVLSAYVKLPDGGAITSANLQLLPIGITETYTSLGDGWYKVSGSFAGTAGALNHGIILPGVAGWTVYLAGIQLEEKAYDTPLCYGDMLGCAWTGTAHASTSTRTLGLVKVSGQHDISEGTFIIAWQASIASTSYTANGTLLHDDNTDMLFQWEWSTLKWGFTDGVNTVNSAADSFSSGDVFIFHVVYGPSGLNIYKNGVSVASGSTYSPGGAVPLAHNNLVIGSTAAGTGRSRGTIRGLSVYPHELTAAEVLADYNNISPILEDGQGLAPIPWLWTKDGDNVVDNANDSNRDNFIIANGIAGDMQAISVFDITQSHAAGTTGDAIYSLLKLDTFQKPDNFYGEFNGTVDANSSGGEYEQISIGTSPTFEYITITNYLDILRQLAGVGVRVICRLYDAGSNLRLATYILQGSGAYTTTTISPTTTTQFRTFITPAGAIAALSPQIMAWGEADGGGNLGIGLSLSRSTGTANIRLDYIQIAFEPIFIVKERTGNNSSYIINGDEVVMYSGATIDTSSGEGSIGGKLELSPNKYNILFNVIGDAENNHLITYTLTYNSVHITPRWRIF